MYQHHNPSLKTEAQNVTIGPLLGPLGYRPLYRFASQGISTELQALCRLLHGLLAPTSLLSVDQYVLVCIPEPYSLCVPTPTVADCLNALHIYSGTLLPAGLTTSDQLWYDEN